MDTLPALLVILGGLLLRLVVPIAGTLMLVHLLRKLDAYWQAEAEQMPVMVQKIECWKYKNCPEEERKTCVAASSSVPCWQVHRQPNGYLQDKCLSCDVFRNAPIPALKIEPRRM